MNNTAARQYVSAQDSENLLTSLAQHPGEPHSGFFGPGSITWQVNRESAVFLGAGRAALLQLAHPWVAVALAQHSTLLNDPIARFHSTFRVIYTMLFGTRAQALAASRNLYQLHTRITGQLPQATNACHQIEHYQANEVAALRWVYATLVDSAILAYEFLLPPLSTAERDDYYVESKRMGALFGIHAEALPNDWSAFTRYLNDMFDSSQLAVGREGAALAASVMSGAGTRLHPPHWYRALTASWLPPRLRDAFALPFNEPEMQAVGRASRMLPGIYRRLPALLRYVGPFHEAEARLRGQRTGPLIRRSNAFWMGQPRLLHSELADLA